MQATLFRGVKGIRGLGKKLKKGGKKDSDAVSIGYPKVDFDQNSVQAPDDAVESEDDAESLYDEVQCVCYVYVCEMKATKTTDTIHKSNAAFSIL